VCQTYRKPLDWIILTALWTWPLFQFLNLYTFSRNTWTGDLLVARLLATYTRRTTQAQNKRAQTSVPWLGFEPMIPLFERGETVHGLDCEATMISNNNVLICHSHKILDFNYMKFLIVWYHVIALPFLNRYLHWAPVIHFRSSRWETTFTFSFLLYKYETLHVLNGSIISNKLILNFRWKDFWRSYPSEARLLQFSDTLNRT
jgi:hypothetical protein